MSLFASTNQAWQFKTLFESKFTADADPTNWTSFSSGAGAVNFVSGRNSVSLSVSGIGESSLKTSAFSYTADTTRTILFSVNLLSLSASGVIKEFGYYDDNSGFFYRADSKGFAVVQRSKSSGIVKEKIVYNSSWPKITFQNQDYNAFNFYHHLTFYIQFDWIGDGVVKFGYLQNSQEDKQFYALSFSEDDLNYYVSNPILPLTIKIKNSSSAAVSDSLDVLAVKIIDHINSSESSLNSSGTLDVNIVNTNPIAVSGNLQITGTSVNVTGVAVTNTPLPVYIVSGNFVLTDNFLNQNEITASGLIDSTIFSYTVPTAQKLYLSQVLVGGQDVGEFSIKINSVVKAKIRNSWATPSLPIYFGYFEIAASGVLDITVYNAKNKPTAYYATVAGFLSP